MAYVAEFSSNAEQTIAPGESAVFTNVVVPDASGTIRHRGETGSFLINGGRIPTRRCGCPIPSYVPCTVRFGGNIAVPTGGTVGTISMAVAIDGTSVPATEMDVTPAAVEEYFNIACDASVPIWTGCCETISIRNISDQPILLKNANLTVKRPKRFVISNN